MFIVGLDSLKMIDVVFIDTPWRWKKPDGRLCWAHCDGWQVWDQVARYPRVRELSIYTVYTFQVALHILNPSHMEDPLNTFQGCTSVGTFFLLFSIGVCVGMFWIIQLLCSEHSSKHTWCYEDFNKLSHKETLLSHCMVETLCAVHLLTAPGAQWSLSYQFCIKDSCPWWGLWGLEQCPLSPALFPFPWMAWCQWTFSDICWRLLTFSGDLWFRWLMVSRDFCNLHTWGRQAPLQTPGISLHTWKPVAPQGWVFICIILLSYFDLLDKKKWRIFCSFNLKYQCCGDKPWMGHSLGYWMQHK